MVRRPHRLADRLQLLRRGGGTPLRVAAPAPLGWHGEERRRSYVSTVYSLYLRTVYSLQIPQFHRTPELGFRALLTEGATWRVEVSRA